MQLLGFPVERVRAGGGVEEVAVRDLKFGVAFVEAPAGVDHVIHTLQLAFGDVGTGEGDEVVHEEIVEVWERFHGGGPRICGEGHTLSMV